jgi:hypothetical protein
VRASRSTKTSDTVMAGSGGGSRPSDRPQHHKQVATAIVTRICHSMIHSILIIPVSSFCIQSRTLNQLQCNLISRLFHLSSQLFFRHITQHRKSFSVLLRPLDTRLIPSNTRHGFLLFLCLPKHVLHRVFPIQSGRD